MVLNGSRKSLGNRLPFIKGGRDMVPKNRKPTSPGEILAEEFLKPLHMTQKKLAQHIGCDIKVINRIVNGKTSITVPMAFKLAAAFQTTPEFWLNAQRAVDLHEIQKEIKKLPKPLRKIA